jgi:hypothetical protein
VQEEEDNLRTEEGRKIRQSGGAHCGRMGRGLSTERYRESHLPVEDWSV